MSGRAVCRPVLDVEVTVRDVRREGTLCHLRLDWPDLFRAARAGQFALVKSLRAGAPLLPRPLSLVPDEDGPVLVFNVAGEGTLALSAAKPGEHVVLVGPLGNAFALPAERIAIIADAPHAGTMLALARERSAAGLPASILYLSERSRPHPSDGPIARAFAATDHPMTTGGAAGLAEALLRTGCAAIAAGAALEALALVQDLAEERGLDGEVALQAPMACGLGACQVCIVPARPGGSLLACHGPVFALSRPDFQAARGVLP